MYVFRELMAGNPKSIPGYDGLLLGYFPKAIQDAYPDDIRQHMLADEIAMTVATTQVIADGGAALVPILMETTGAGVMDIVTAYLKAERLARLAEVRSTLEQLRSTVSMSALSESFVRVGEGARMVALFWLSARGRVPTDDELESMLEAIDQYSELQSTEAVRESRVRVDELLGDDIPEHIARLIVKARFLNLALMAWSISHSSDNSLRDAIIKLQSVGHGSRLLEIIEDLAVRPAHGSWEPIALRILFVRFLHLLRELLNRLQISEPVDTVDKLRVALEGGALSAVRSQVEDLLAEDERPSPATLLVLEERVAAAMSRLS
jgi:NAD-specific glutamate dehydrogenase